MSRSSFRRTTLVLLLLTLLTTPLASAAVRQAQPRAATPAPVELLSRAWSLLASLWGEEGCHIDPDGRCVTNPVQVAPPQVHEGCHIDPNGRCVTNPVQAAPPHLDTGCHIDPDGRCAP
jgi:hypothetical protein